MLTISQSIVHCAAARGRQASLIVLIPLALAACGGSDGTGLKRIEFDTERTPVRVFQCFRSSLTVSSFFDDGAVEDATQSAELSSSDPSIVRISDGNSVTPSGTEIPKGTLTPVGEPGESATITATLDDSRTTVDVVIEAGRLQLTPPRPMVAEGTQVALHPTAILGDPGDQNIFLADNLVSYSVGKPDESEAGDTAAAAEDLLTVDDDGNAIAVDNDLEAGASIPLIVTASTDTFNADRSGACSAGEDSVRLTIRNETLDSLDINLPSSELPENVSQTVSVAGQFTGDHTQDLTAGSTLQTESDTVAQFGIHGQNVVTTLPGAAEQSTNVRATFDRGLDDSTEVQTQAELSVTPETLDSLAIQPEDASVLPGTALRYAVIGTFTDESNNSRQFNITRDVFWSLRDSATDEPPNPEVVTISNASGSKGQVTALQDDVDPVMVRAQRTQEPGSDSPPDTALQASTELSFDAVLASLTINGPDNAIGVEQSTQLTVTGNLARGDTQPLTALAVWRSSDPEIAVVSNSPFSPGRLTGISPGSVEITARYDGATALHEITVQSEADTDPDPEPEPNPPMCTIPNPIPLLPLDCLIPQNTTP